MCCCGWVVRFRRSVRQYKPAFCSNISDERCGRPALFLSCDAPNIHTWYITKLLRAEDVCFVVVLSVDAQGRACVTCTVVFGLDIILHVDCYLHYLFFTIRSTSFVSPLWLLLVCYAVSCRSISFET